MLHPALETDPGHAIWKRDFTGASGLFSVVLKPAPQKAVDALLDAVKLFGMGYSWGGFESLAIPFDCDSYRTATRWTPGGPTLRLHIGLEHVEDLKADLAQRVCGFQRRDTLKASLLTLREGRHARRPASPFLHDAPTKTLIRCRLAIA